MGAVVILRELWRHRIVVALGAVLGILVALTMAYRIHLPFTLESKSYEVGVASTTALVDTPTSQVVDLGDSENNSAGAPPGGAALIASLLGASPLKDEIAKKAGVDPKTLIGGSPRGVGGSGGAADAAPVGTISPKDSRASILTVQSFESLPIIAVDVQAPD